MSYNRTYDVHKHTLAVERASPATCAEPGTGRRYRWQSTGALRRALRQEASRAVSAGGGAAAACSLDMEEGGLGTTLPTQQWAGFERFKEVQEILDRNKCATPTQSGCLEALRSGSNAHRLLINEINANHESKQ